jgi:hypothetical protein
LYRLFSIVLALSLPAALPLFGQLRIDFNDRSNDFPSRTQEGFDPFVLGAVGSSTAIQPGTNTLQFGAVKVSIWDPSSAGCDDRNRGFPPNQGSFTNGPLLQDLVFSVGTNTNSGLSILLQGLPTNVAHQVTIWSYDFSALGTRVSDWYANGVLQKTNYTFTSGVNPSTNGAFQFSLSATSSVSGEILIQGLRKSNSVDQNGAAAPGVFLNGLELSPGPDHGPACNTATHFKVGSNIYGWTGGSSFAEQDQEVAALKAAGLTRARINVVWFAVEPTQKGVYDIGLLSLYDHLMQKLGESAIKAIFVTADTPYWASSDPAKFTDASGQHWNTRYKPSNNNDLADYYVFLLNRYRSTGPHAFEVWNEQDNAYFWPPSPSATDFAVLLHAVHDSVKAADPNAIVLNGGLTDSTGAAGYMSALYAAGAAPWFDVWSQHLYPRAPEYETVVQTARSVMVANGDGAKKIWVTETGWPTYTNAADASAVSYARQARYLTNLLTRLAGYPYVQEMHWYTSRSYDETVKEGSFGLSLPDFTRKPSYYAMSSWVAQAGAICPPGWITLLGVTRPTTGSVVLSFDAPTGFAYAVQSSGDLGQWSTMATNVTSSNTVHFYQDPAPAATNRFYRVFWPPTAP